MTPYINFKTESPFNSFDSTGLAGIHQISNASLAVNLVQTFLQSQESIEPQQPLPQSYVEGLKNVKWPGRCQTVHDPKHANTTWFLDGAHTIESLDCCVRWFVSPGIGLTINPSSLVLYLSDLHFYFSNGSRTGNNQSAYSYSTLLMGAQVQLSWDLWRLQKLPN